MVPRNSTTAVPLQIKYSYLTLLGPQSRFEDNWGQITWSLSGLSPKRDCGSKGVVKHPSCRLEMLCRVCALGGSCPAQDNMSRCYPTVGRAD